MRSALKGAAVVVASLALSPSAVGAAGLTQATLTGTIAPAVGTVSVPPRSVALSIVTRFATNPPGGQPATVKRAVIFFSHGATVNSSLFPSCSAKRLDVGGVRACPSGSRIGSGSAIGTGAGTVEPLKITTFNGPGGHSLLFYLTALTPIRIAEAIQAPLVKINSLFYAYRITLNVPQNLQVLGGIAIGVTLFQTTVKATVVHRVDGRIVRRGFVEVPLCPPGALVPLRGVFTFNGAPPQTVNSSIACGEPPPA